MQQINLLAPINELGYGKTGLNVLKSLSKLTEVALWPIGEPQVTNADDQKVVESAIKRCETANLQAPCIKIWHQHDMSFPEFIKGTRIGFPIFELNKFTPLEVSQLNSTDHLFAPSQWGKAIIELNDISSPCDVVPLGVDSTLFKIDSSDPHPHKVFFNCGKWEIRKGHDVLIDIWDDFCHVNPDHGWELWMMTENPFNTPQEERMWRKTYQRDNIRFIPRVKTHEEVYNIMRQTACGIFPSRAEGWNLELLEMLALGKQCIATDYSAHTEFCDNTNTYLIKIDCLESAYDGKWFFGDGEWAQIGQDQIDQIVYSMGEVVYDWDNTGINIPGVSTGEQFSWDNTAKRILQHVEVL